MQGQDLIDLVNRDEIAQLPQRTPLGALGETIRKVRELAMRMLKLLPLLGSIGGRLHE